jgi:hypothetical protein
MHPDVAARGGIGENIGKGTERRGDHFPSTENASSTFPGISPNMP